MTDLPAAAIPPDIADDLAVKVRAAIAAVSPFVPSLATTKVMLEAAAPLIAAADPATEAEGFRAYKAGVAAGRAEGAAAERERIRQGSPHRVETGGEYCQEDGFRWPCRTARWLADLLTDAP